MRQPGSRWSAVVILVSSLRCSVSAQENEKGPAVVLHNRLMEVVVSNQTGAIASAQRREERTPLLQDCFDQYELTDDGEPVTADEREDQVLSTLHVSRFTLSFACRNPVLERVGISLTKRYTLREGEDYVIREITFHHRGSEPRPSGDGYFIEAWANVTLEPTFRRSGYYYVPCGHSLPRLPAARVAFDTPLYSSIYLFINTAAIAFVDPARNLTAASYLVATNGRYTSWGFGSNTPEEVPRYNPVATPTGWRHYAHRNTLKPGGQSSYRVRYTLLRGDSTALLRQYFEDRERKRLASPHPVPAWMKDVKLMMFVTQAYHFDDERIALWKELAARLGSGYLMPMFDRWGHASGDYPVADEETERLRRTVERLHREIPTAKVGTYVIIVLGDQTETYQQHPDWAVRDRQGKSPVADFPGRYPPQFQRKDVQAHYREGILSVVRKLGLDYLYVDGSDGSAFEPADWGSRLVGHFADRYALMRNIVDELKSAIRNSQSEIGVFFNQPASLLADAGFLEMGGGQWSDEGDWRSISDACYFAKLATRYRPGTWASPLYPYDLRKYFSTMLAFALRPNFTPVNREQLDEFLTQWLPYVNAAYEIKDAHLRDAPLSPNWRVERTDWDAQALQQGGTLLLTAVNHGQEPAEQSLSVDLRTTSLAEGMRGLGRGAGRLAAPLFVWTRGMSDPLARSSEEPAVKPLSLEVVERIPERLRVPVYGERNLAQIVTVSPVPAWVLAVEGYRTQIRLTETMGVRIAGGMEARQINLRVTAPKRCEILVYCPANWKNAVVRMDRLSVPVQEMQEAGQRFMVVPVALTGPHTITVTPAG